MARHKAEDARIAIRNIRRHAKDTLEKMIKDGDAGEDDVSAPRSISKRSPTQHVPPSTSCSSTRKPSCSRSDGSRPARRRRRSDRAETAAGAVDAAPRVQGEPRKRRARPGGAQPARGDRRRRRPGRCHHRAAVLPCPLALRRRARGRRGARHLRDRQRPARPRARSRRCCRCCVGGAACSSLAYRGGPEPLLLGARAHRAGLPRLAARRPGRGLPRATSPRGRVHRRLRAVPRRLRGAARPARTTAPRRVTAFIATVVCSDVGGYAAGVPFGQAPDGAVGLAEEVLGGLRRLAGGLRGGRRGLLRDPARRDPLSGPLYGLAVVGTATLGDLGESMVKRDIGIKDMGDLLPATAASWTGSTRSCRPRRSRGCCSRPSSPPPSGTGGADWSGRTPPT